MTAKQLAEGVALMFGLDPAEPQGERLVRLIVSAINDAVAFGVTPDETSVARAEFERNGQDRW